MRLCVREAADTLDEWEIRYYTYAYHSNNYTDRANKKKTLV